MKNNVPRTWFTSVIVALVGCLFVTVTGWLLASPAQDISSAVTSGGAKNVKAASADTFVNAFSSVLTGVDDEHSASYVAAAKQMRPDLSKQIDAAANEVENGPSDNSPNEDRRVSRHRRRVPVCCFHHNDYHTVFIPQQGVQHFLATHPMCRRGTCASHWHHPQT
jgi:hypothetical protein